MKVKHVSHEYGLNGQHRILLLDDAGEMHPGEWAAYTAIAQNRDYLAATEFHEGSLPAGVFRVNKVQHVTVTA